MSASGSGAGGPPPLRRRRRNDNKPQANSRQQTPVSVVVPPLPSPTPSTSSSSSESPAPAQDVVAESLAKLESGDYITIPKVFKKSKKQPSEVWTTFHVVVDKNTLLEVGTAQCITCSAVLVYNSNSGPSSLKKHHDSYCTAQLAGAGGSNTPYRPVPGGLRGVFIDKVADTCALTMGAVDMLTSDAVVDMVQTAVDIAARCKGRVDVRALMPSRTTVMAHINTRADEATAELVPRVRAAIRDGRCQGSTDMWTDDNTKNHFIAVTVSFTNERGDASETHDLTTAKFPTSVKATGANIRAAMVQKLQSIGISVEDFEKIEWVTDRGANVRKALEDLPREDCTAHIINTVVRSSLSVPYYELRQKAIEAVSPQAQDVLSTAEEVVRAVKAAPPGLAVQGVVLKTLKKSLILPQAQYHSKFSTMLTSICVNKQKALRTLAALGQHELADKLRTMDADLVSDLVDFIGPLEKTKTVAAGDLASLKQHLSTGEEDTQETLRMKGAVQDLRVLMDVLSLIKEAKEVVTFMKSTGLASLLKKKVLQEVETRWNSIETMLFSVLDSFDDIVTVLAGHGEGDSVSRMDKLDRVMLQWLTDFLQEFKAETKTLEGNDLPTLPCVLLASSNLRDHCEPDLLDCPQLEVLKKRSLHFLEEKFKPSMKAKIATFLWPDYKELTMLTEEDREEVKAKVRALIAAEAAPGAAAAPEPDDHPDNPDTVDPAPPAPKVPRLDRYSKYRVRPAGVEQRDEVDKYLATSVSVPLDQLLQHWKMLDRPDGLPGLAKLALRELGKLATAAPSERVWSKTGFILNKRRNKLTPQHLNSIIVLGSFLRFKRKELKKNVNN